MDLADFKIKKDAEAGVAMVIESPVDGKPVLAEDGKPMTITLVGKDHKDYLAAAHDQNNRRIKQAAAVGRLKVSSVELLADHIDLLVACTKSWHGIKVGGQDLDFSEDNAR